LNESFLRDFKNVINHQLQEMENQIQLSLEDISCPVRAELGSNINLLYMRIMRIALRDTYGGKLSAAILYQAGKSIAMTSFDILEISDLTDYLNQLMLGKTKVVETEGNRIVFEEDECAVCSGMPDIGEALCSFESGFIAGGLSKMLDMDVVVSETQCWGLGDGICRFEADLFPKGTLQNDGRQIGTMDMIATLASKASMAIELNKELQYKNDIFNKQLEFAQNIQKSIIPDASQFKTDKLDFYTYLKPFRKVGGDFYDIFKLGDENVGITIADMAGHGIDAAMITTMVKLILRHCSFVEGVLKDPSRVMKYVERDMGDVLPDAYFSMIYMTVDTRHQSITYSNAGHPSPILYRKQQNLVQFLKANLPLVGLNKYMSEQIFASNSILYEPGDQLFLFTDGIPEVRNIKGDFFNINHMLDIIKDPRLESVEAIGKEIIRQTSEFRSFMSQEDDICLIGIQL
jgi:sigma-B regulation protein RsbU (phosphoserine phosphatase)